jgi:hypothetical protein
VRFLHFYLIAYFALIIGACVALWQAGVLARVPVIWLLVSAIILIGLGLLLAVTSVRPTTIVKR